MAVSLRTVRPVSSEASAMNMATPALGPSLGMAPAGTWMWMSDFSNRRHRCRGRRLRDLTRVSAAWALSFITSPSWPVRMSLPLPGMRVASTNRMSPPTGVQARPVATPGTLVRMATSCSKRGAPRMAARSPSPIGTLSTAASAMRMATWRHTAPISRSRLRTPASRV